MTDDDFVTQMASDSSSMTDDDHKQAGSPVSGQIGDEHSAFLETLFRLLDDGTIDHSNPESIIKQDVYDAMPEEWQDKVDLAKSNIVDQIRLIDTLRQAGESEAIHLQTMVEHLWEMKQRIEEHHDVFVF